MQQSIYSWYPSYNYLSVPFGKEEYRGSLSEEIHGELRAMAGGFVDGAAGQRAKFYEGRITSYFILACLVGSFGGGHSSNMILVF